MSNQTKEILTQMDEKLISFTQEIAELKLENQSLKEKIVNLEKNRRINNIVITGLKEKEQSSTELVERETKKIKTDLNISFESKDINMIYRIGKKQNGNNGKGRPVLVSLSNNWKKNEIMKNKKKLKDAYANDDYPKEVLDKRRELQEKLIEERKKGNYAVIKYDKLFVSEGKKL